MGIKLSFPLKQQPIAYYPTSYYTCMGRRRKDDYTQDTTFFHKLQANYWEDLLCERRKEQEAKMKFKDEDIETINRYIARFPSFTAEQITDLKLQFQTFDLNQDGLIDFNELIQVLDDLGDQSTPERRIEYFQEIDEDGSGAIDFEEYIGLIYHIHHEATLSTDNGIASKFGNDHLHTLRQLRLSQKLSNGLF